MDIRVGLIGLGEVAHVVQKAAEVAEAEQRLRMQRAVDS